MTMILTSVTKVGWADVQDSDWGDFRRRRAVDISIFFRGHPSNFKVTLAGKSMIWSKFEQDY